MILDFSISNFGSIRNKQTLSFEASESTHLEEYFVVKMGEYRILKIATLIGANASGKSNVLKAFDLLYSLVMNPCINKESEITYNRFLLDKDCLNKPSEIVVNFIIDEALYNYSISFDNKVIYNEVLKYKPFSENYERTVFERNTDKDSLFSTIKWGGNYCSESSTQSLLGNLLHNRTLFGAYLHSNVEIPLVRAILGWFRQYCMPMVTTRNQELQMYISHHLINNLIDKNLMVHQLKKADFGISDLVVEEIKRPLNQQALDILLNTDFLSDRAKQLLKDDSNHVGINISMSHNGYQDHVFMDFNLESGGTQRYYELSGLLLKIIQEPHFIAIDELECRLHPDLYQHFLTTYLSNSTQSQLIFSTHFTEFLSDKDLFRDDSVWITQKSAKGDTELYSLFDFDKETLNESTNRFHAYRLGELGGVPILGDSYVPIN